MELSDLFDVLAGYLDFCINLLSFREMGAYSKVGTINPALVSYSIAGIFFGYIIAKSKSFPGYQALIERRRRKAHSGEKEEEGVKDEPVARAVDFAGFVLVSIVGAMILHGLLLLYSGIICHADLGNMKDTLNAALGSNALYHPVNALYQRCSSPLFRLKAKPRPAKVIKWSMWSLLQLGYFYFAIAYPLYFLSVVHDTSFMYMFWTIPPLCGVIFPLVFGGVIVYVVLFGSQTKGVETQCESDMASSPFSTDEQSKPLDSEAKGGGPE